MKSKSIGEGRFITLVCCTKVCYSPPQFRKYLDDSEYIVP